MAFTILIIVTLFNRQSRDRDRERIKMFITKAINKGYEAQRCEICNTTFNLLLLNRIHKCKRCLRFVCANCGKHNMHLIEQSGEESVKHHRICVLCKEDSDLIISSIKKVRALQKQLNLPLQYELAWAKDSNFSKSWLSKMQAASQLITKWHFFNMIDVTLRIKDYNYQHFLKIFYQNKEHYKEALDVIQKDVLLGRTDRTVFNTSMRQFFYRVQQNASKESIRRSIANILCAATSRWPNIGYCQGMSGIVAFLLCFASEQSCFNMFCDLLENVLPLNLYAQSEKGINLIGLLAELSMIKGYLQHILEKQHSIVVSPAQKDTMDTVIDVMGTKCLLTLFVGNLSFSNTLFLWEQLLQTRSYSVIQKTMLSIMYLFRESVSSSAAQFKKLQRFIENLDHSNLVQVYHEITIDPDRRNQLVQKYYQDFSKQWNDQDNKGTAGKLANLTRFTKDEIQQIRQSFAKILNKGDIGLSRKQFVEFMLNYLKKCKIEFLDYLNRNRSIENTSEAQRQIFTLNRFFDSFDSEKNNQLDFRQFMCCLSVVLRGNIKDRLVTLIETVQTEQGYLSSDVFVKLVFEVLETIRQVVQYDEELVQMEDSFKVKVNNLYNDERVSRSELYILMSDPFMSEAAVRTIAPIDQQQVKDICRALAALANTTS